MSHELAEKTAGLASRVDNLVALQTGEGSRMLELQQERLEKLALAAIAADLAASEANYQAAIKGLNAAINRIGDADKAIQKISGVIKLVARAADLVEAALKAVGASVGV